MSLFDTLLDINASHLFATFVGGIIGLIIMEKVINKNLIKEINMDLPAIKLLIENCEKNLPRNKYCKLAATPEE